MHLNLEAAVDVYIYIWKEYKVRIYLIQKYSSYQAQSSLMIPATLVFLAWVSSTCQLCFFYEHWRKEWIQSSRVEQFGGRRSGGVGGGEEREIFVIFMGCRVALSTAL